VKRQQQLTYSIHRPTAIFGFAEGNLMNMVSTLAVYAAICQYENKPLIFPGSKMCWDFMQDASDADLVAEQEIWAASVADPKAKNEALAATTGMCSSGNDYGSCLLRNTMYNRSTKANRSHCRTP
jgi:hypothetical protein